MTTKGDTLPMSRRLAVVILAALCWPEIAAAGLTVTAPAQYTPGDEITVTISGDSEGRTAVLMRALLAFDASLDVVSGSPRFPLDDTSPLLSWSYTGAMARCGIGLLAPTQCVAADAFEFTTFAAASVDLLPSQLSVFRFDTTQATGDLVFTVEPDGAGFFGLPGTQATVSVIAPPVPTLSPAALAALGLLAAGTAVVAWRRRARREHPA